MASFPTTRKSPVATLVSDVSDPWFATSKVIIKNLKPSAGGSLNMFSD